MKISVKLTVCYILAVVLVFVSVNLIGTRRYREKERQEIRENYHSIAVNIADNTVSAYYYSGDIASIRSELIRTAKVTGARLWLINSAGTVIVDSASREITGTEGYDPKLLEQTYTENYIIYDDPDVPMLAVMEPVMSNYRTSGYVCVFTPMSIVDSKTTKNMDVINLSLIIVCGGLLVIFAVIFLIIAIPAKKIRNAAMEFSKGNYDYKFRIRSHDEFRDLSDAMNYMVGELQSTEEKQRKFIANISHDFRSPLTSIKGYAEAIKDGTIPYESKDKYLDIILSESERLHKLTSNILELNSMDNGAVKLNIKSFSITKVIKSIADSFEGICRQKKLKIKLQFEESDMIVDADQGKIEQVIYNLTDNAIKFSESGSEIVIGAEIKGSKTVIRVKDSGCGIPKDSIKKIWDRFYKSDSSRGRDKKGTGLGLSIVKEIITAHDENINVISTEGVGTEFSFTLPVA